MEIRLTSGGWIWSDCGDTSGTSNSSSNSNSSNATTTDNALVPFELLESSNVNLDKTVNIAGLRITQVNNDKSSPILEFRFTSAKCKRLLALNVISNSKIYELYGSTSVIERNELESGSGDDSNDGFSYICTQAASVFPLSSISNAASAKEIKETFRLDYDGTSSSTPALTAFRIKFLSLKCSGSTDSFRHLHIFSLQMHYLSDKLSSSPNPNKGRLASIVSNTPSPSANTKDSSSTTNNNSSSGNDIVTNNTNNTNNNDNDSNIRGSTDSRSTQLLQPGTPSSHSSTTLQSQPHSQDALVKAIMSQLEVILPMIIGPLDTRMRKMEEKIADVDGKVNRLQSQLNKMIREDS